MTEESRLDQIEDNIEALQESLIFIANAVEISEKQRIKDKKEILEAIQYLIDVQTHGYKKLSEKIEELSNEN